MRIVLSGPPSVGKSTQGQALATWLGVPHISSGGLIRKRAAAGDPVAARLLNIVADGSLAPSGDIIDMVLDRLRDGDCEAGFILDGFPRKPEEAIALLDNLDGLDCFVVLRASAQTLTERVVERSRQFAVFRADDDPAVFPRRIQVYETETRIVREVMRSRGVLAKDVDASGAPDEVQAAVRFAISPLLQIPDEPLQMGFNL